MRKKKYIYLFFIAVGLLTAIFFGSNFFLEYHFFERTYFDYWSGHDFEKSNVFWLILFSRLKILIFILLLNYSVVKKYVRSVLVFFLSFMIGIYNGMLCMAFGFWGIAIFVASFFPHFLCYIIGLDFLLEKEDENYHNKYGKTIIALVIITAGIFMEAFWSFDLLQKISRMVG